VVKSVKNLGIHAQSEKKSINHEKVRKSMKNLGEKSKKKVRKIDEKLMKKYEKFDEKKYDFIVKIWCSIFPLAKFYSQQSRPELVL